MNKVTYLLAVMVVVFNLSTVADASFASTWDEAKSKVEHVAHDAEMAAAKAVTAVKNFFTGSNQKGALVTPKPANPVTTKTAISPAESTFVKTSARNSESSVKSSYSHPYGSGSNTYESSSDQGSASFGQWTSSGRSAYGSRTHEPITARTYGYGSRTYESNTPRSYGYGSRNHESTPDRTSAYGRRNSATYGQYSGDSTSGSGYSRGNNYGYSSYSKGSPYSDTYYFSEDELSSVG